MAYKLFFNKTNIQKDKTPAQIEEMKDQDWIYASQGLGKPYVFKRFQKVYTSYGWSNSGNHADGIAYLPQKNVKVCGFSTFAARSKDCYEMKYRVKIDGTEVEQETITATGWEDEHYYRHKLNGVYDAPAGSKIDISVWIAENLGSNSYVETYYGEDGNSYETIENEHMGLFKIESGDDSNNGTSVYSGHLGEIMYYLG